MFWLFDSNGLIMWVDKPYPLNFSKIIIQEKINHLLDNPILLKVSNTII